MRTLRLLFLPLVVALVFVTVYSHAGAIKAARPSAPSTCNWRVVSSPNPSGQNFNSLTGVAAISANSIWAVGTSYHGGIPNQAIIEHWNGTSWSLVSNPGSGSSLQSVVALAANNVWTVGTKSSQTFIEHWNGTKWSVVSSPNASSEDFLNGVAATSSSDVWAVGYFFNNSDVRQTMIEHWNGTKWSLVSSPNTGSNFNTLSGVSAISPKNAWAVGDVYDASTNIDQPLVEHWNGTSWKVVSTPSIANAGLAGITAISASDMWAVGTTVINGGTNSQPLTEHWNGTKWSIVSGPTPFSSLLFSVSALSTSNVWTVGVFNNSSGGSSTLVEHWNGTKWATVTSPNPKSFSSLNGAVAVSANHVWAVGDTVIGTGGIGNTLIETRC